MGAPWARHALKNLALTMRQMTHVSVTPQLLTLTAERTLPADSEMNKTSIVLKSGTSRSYCVDHILMVKNVWYVKERVLFRRHWRQLW